jgi:hypothetical protein
MDRNTVTMSWRWLVEGPAGRLVGERVVAALDLPLDTVVGHVLDLHRRGVTVVLTLDPARGHRRHPDRMIPDRDLRRRLVGCERSCARR